GRAWASETEATVRIERFRPSERYRGYEELANAKTEQVIDDPSCSAFVAIANEVADLAERRRTAPTCSGADALAVQETLELLAAEPSISSISSGDGHL